MLPKGLAAYYTKTQHTNITNITRFHKELQSPSVANGEDSEIKELKSQLEIVEVLEKSIIVKNKHIEEVEMNNKSKDSEIKVLNIKLSEMEEKLEVTEEILKQRELEEEEWDESDDSSSDTKEEAQKAAFNAPGVYVVQNELKVEY